MQWLPIFALRAAGTFAALSMVCAAHAESPRREALRTGEAETAEPATTEPLKEALQNLFLQEDVFPQPHGAVQFGARVGAFEEDGEFKLQTQTIAEAGVGDSWTLSATVPFDVFPRDERRLSNPAAGVLYSFWISPAENGRFSASLQTTVPSPASGGEHAFAHEASLIGYVRFAPLHLQAVAGLDVSHGPDVHGVPARPEGAVAAILKLGDVAFDWEVAVDRQFDGYRRLAAFGVIAYPGPVEIGVAARADWTELPITVGGLFLISGQADLGG